MGQRPLVEVPMKGEYSKRDFSRSARLHKVRYNHPGRFPIGAVAACRAFYWVSDRDPAQARRLAKALYQAYFVDNVDIDATAAVVELAESVGVDGSALSA